MSRPGLTLALEIDGDGSHPQLGGRSGGHVGTPASLAEKFTRFVRH